ncbi:hypothetical protein Y032_0013g2037 [Ancylostoma ceylanicum]|nr:hypothetical protein Y032_0013g2037 [Ancylostoma ceylanicum]
MFPFTASLVLVLVLLQSKWSSGDERVDDETNCKDKAEYPCERTDIRNPLVEGIKEVKKELKYNCTLEELAGSVTFNNTDEDWIRVTVNMTNVNHTFFTL